MKIPALVLVFAVAFGGTPALAADPPAAKPAASAEPAVRKDVNEPLDYSTLSHSLSIESLRAGSHDESGTNDYVFKATMFGLLNSSEERNLPFQQRKKVTVELGPFGDTKIESLAIWKPDEKAKDFKELKVDGNAVRELAAKTMGDFKVQEGDVAVMVEVAMFSKHKKLFFFFGDEQQIATASYYPIPTTKYDTPLRTNQLLTITDDKGTNVKIAVRYEKPAGTKK